MRRWNSKTTIATGIVMTTAAAAIDPVGCWNWDAPVKKAMAAGTVRALLVDVSEIANTKSLQQYRNTRIAVVCRILDLDGDGLFCRVRDVHGPDGGPPHVPGWILDGSANRVDRPILHLVITCSADLEPDRAQALGGNTFDARALAGNPATERRTDFTRPDGALEWRTAASVPVTKIDP